MCAKRPWHQSTVVISDDKRWDSRRPTTGHPRMSVPSLRKCTRMCQAVAVFVVLGRVGEQAATYGQRVVRGMAATVKYVWCGQEGWYGSYAKGMARQQHARNMASTIVQKQKKGVCPCNGRYAMRRYVVTARRRYAEQRRAGIEGGGSVCAWQRQRRA